MKFTWITGVETIKRQTRAARGCLAAKLQVVCAGLAYSPRPHNCLCWPRLLRILL